MYEALTAQAANLRRTTFEAFVEQGEAHLGGSFSIIETLIALYEVVMSSEDKFILSKAHASFPLCILLREKGLEPELSTHLEIDVDNFDNRMKAIAPRAAFAVPNTLTGEGNMAVDITFESMDDFSPAAIAAKVEPLKELLDARTQLSNLMTYMDGKTGAEDLISKIMQDPSLLKTLAAQPKPSDEAVEKE